MVAALRDGGYVSSLADPDVWMKPQVKANGDKYWQYVLCYVDDLLVISHDPKQAMAYLGSRFTLKEGSVKEPDVFLGAEIKKWNLNDPNNPTKTRWAMSSDLYVKCALADVEKELADAHKKLHSKVTTPMTQSNRVELDTTPELDAKRANYYQGLIGTLRWMCELGRLDILVNVAMLSRYLAAPREGHLEQVFHIFGYLKSHGRSALVFDDTKPFFAEDRFKKCD